MQELSVEVKFSQQASILPYPVELKLPIKDKCYQAAKVFYKDKELPAQVELSEEFLTVCWLTPPVEEPYKLLYYRLVLLEAPEVVEAAGAARVLLVDHPEDGYINCMIGGKLFLGYYYKNYSKPFIYPLIGPSGVSLTRDAITLDKTKDHPHQRSLWVAHGDVSGYDFWSELEGSCKICHKEFKKLISGDVYAKILSINHWVNTSGEALLEEERSIKVYNLPEGSRLLDLSIRFNPVGGPVVFGDTKEGGMIALRVAEGMEVKNGGRLENATGAVGEAEVWGKRANWCDYSGSCCAAGGGGEYWGIAILDHPNNLRHPTYWHARAYGLMAANPFGISVFEGNEALDGSYELTCSLLFNYRIYVHRGDAKAAQVENVYQNYAQPPTVKIL